MDNTLCGREFDGIALLELDVAGEIVCADMFKWSLNFSTSEP